MAKNKYLGISAVLLRNMSDKEILGSIETGISVMRTRKKLQIFKTIQDIETEEKTIYLISELANLALEFKALPEKEAS